MREIRVIGDPVLRSPADPVTDFDRELRRLIDEMMQVMYAARGVGLAGPQIGVPRRLFVYDINGRKGHVINPELTIDDPTEVVDDEGCLSVPGLRGLVPRYTRIAYEGILPDGSTLAREVEGWHARVVQHELDHLDGILYPQRMTDLKDLIFESEFKHRVAANGPQRELEE